VSGPAQSAFEYATISVEGVATRSRPEETVPREWPAGLLGWPGGDPVVAVEGSAHATHVGSTSIGAAVVS
jgi:hypothetical protein